MGELYDVCDVTISIFCDVTATNPSTWGKIKELCREAAFEQAAAKIRAGRRTSRPVPCSGGTGCERGRAVMSQCEILIAKPLDVSDLEKAVSSVMRENRSKNS